MPLSECRTQKLRGSGRNFGEKASPVTDRVSIGFIPSAHGGRLARTVATV